MFVDSGWPTQTQNPPPGFQTRPPTQHPEPHKISEGKACLTYPVKLSWFSEPCDILSALYIYTNNYICLLFHITIIFLQAIELIGSVV